MTRIPSACVRCEAPAVRWLLSATHGPRSPGVRAVGYCSPCSMAPYVGDRGSGPLLDADGLIAWAVMSS